MGFVFLDVVLYDRYIVYLLIFFRNILLLLKKVFLFIYNNDVVSFLIIF